MVKMRVHNRDTAWLQLPDGWVVPPGIHEITVYEDNVELVMREVEPDPSAHETASRMLKLALADDVRSLLGGRFTGSTDALLVEMERGGTDIINDALKRVLATTGASVQSEFQRTQRRSMKPLLSATVLEPGITEPQRIMRDKEYARQSNVQSQALSQALAQQSEQLATTVASAVAQAVAATMGPIIAELKELRQRNK